MNRIIRYFNGIYNNWYFKKKKKQAIKAWKITGRQHWLIPLAGKLIIVNRDTINVYNKIAKKKKEKQITIVDLCEIAYYKTPTGKLVR